MDNSYNIVLTALSSATDVKLLIKEIAKMVHFNHPNVMTLTGFILDDRGVPLLVMPFMAKGTLLTYVRDNKTQFLCENEEEPDKVSSLQERSIVCVNPPIHICRLNLLQKHFVNCLVKLPWEWST